jgi:hypothetical protein
MLLIYFIPFVVAFEEDLYKQFDNHVEEIYQKFSQQEWINNSTMPRVWSLDSYQKIRQKGILLIPILIEHHESLVDMRDDYQRFLKNLTISSLYYDITKVKASPENSPWSGEPIGVYWYGGIELSKERFNLLYEKLVTARKNCDKNIITLCHQSIRSMGIYSLQFLINKIEAGDEHLLIIVQDMFNDTLSTKNQKEIIDWWKKNQKQYRLPLQNKEKLSLSYSRIFEGKPILEKVEKLYDLWQSRYLFSKNISSSIQQERQQLSVKLTQLIGYENIPQFKFLADLGEEALPYLFLKLKEEETRFTLPVIEKIMNKKLSPEEIKQHIENAEQLLNKPEPIAIREWTTQDGKFSIEAKYISSKDKKVTLEKVNGSIITVEISKLSTKDQDYIKRQQISEKKQNNQNEHDLN